MANYTVKRIDEMEAIYWGSFKRARAELGVTAFGMQVMDLPAGVTAHPEHDHSEDGQEEVYAVLHGAGEIEIEGERHAIEPGTLVRVGPGTKRKLWPGPEGMRLLIVGGVPGKAYEPPDISELGHPDSTAGQPPPAA